MERPGSVLIVDDEEDLLDTCRKVLEAEGHRVVTATGPVGALESLARGRIDVVLTDLRMPGGSGLDLLREIRSRWPETPVVVLTAYPSVDSTAEAVRAGAFGYLTKPFTPDQLAVTVAGAKVRRTLVAQSRVARRFPTDPGWCGEIVGGSPRIRAVREITERVASVDSNVLILGESGVGKDLVARRIHERSRRVAGRFVAVNCAAIPAALFESELFGHRKGAFTGASEDVPGLFVEAHGGTLFLDEVAEMPREMQAKLLRVIEEKQVRPVGGGEPRAADARILSATNERIEEALDAGTLRRDLYFRLCVVRIEVPPLRERPEDVPALLEHFRRRPSGASEERVLGFSPAAVERLRRHSWPGNVRELENLVERLRATAARPAVVEAGDLDDLLGLARDRERASSQGAPLRLASAERRAVLEALEAAGGNKAEAARLLGISRPRLYRRLREYGFDEK